MYISVVLLNPVAWKQRFPEDTDYYGKGNIYKKQMQNEMSRKY